MLNLRAGQYSDASATVEDNYHNPKPVENPDWTVSDEAILRLDQETPTSVRIWSVGPVGTALVTFQGDADLGAGIEAIIGTLDVVVSAGKVTVVEITAGPPQDPQP